MKSTCLGVLVMLSMAATSHAAIMQFLPGTPATNPLTVLGDGMFELSSEPKAAPNDFQYPAVTSLDVEVIARSTTGDGTMPVVFSLVRGSTRDGNVFLVFENPLYDELFIQFSTPDILQGDPFPTSVTDFDGVVEWSARALAPPSTAPKLAGLLFDGAIVPEPSTAVSSMVGLLMLFAGLRRRRSK